MADTTRTQIPAENQAFYDRNLLTRVMPLLTFTKWAQVRDIPKNGGTDTIKFRRYGNLAAATTPLTEGITPAGKQLSVTDVTAQIDYYGDYVTLTDKVQIETVDPILMETGEVLGDQASDTLDQLARDILTACTQVSYGGAATSKATVDAGDVITTALIDAAVLALKNSNARKIHSQIDANTGYGTSPIRASYVGICHTNLAAKVKALTGFVSVEKYPSQTTVMDGEFGSYGEVRFVETTNGKVTAGVGVGGIDVYSLVIIGADAYGTTRISGEALRNIIKPLGSGGSADPLEQRSTSGWKATFVAKILNQTFIQRIEVSLT